ncbi:Disease resistance protein RML1B [Linum grandiflorum]
MVIISKVDAHHQPSGRVIRSPSPTNSPPTVRLLEKYDVFLNFRGVDLRNKFADHLYTKLNQDIIVFRDDKKLPKGVPLNKIFEVIERSTMSLVLFSKKYAGSKWCLNELVKIADCVEKKGHVALPVFFDVSPEDVKGKSGVYANALDGLGMKYSAAMVDGWRKALATVARTAGWNHAEYKSEATLLKEIKSTIVHMLRDIHARLNPKPFPIEESKLMKSFTPPKQINSLYSLEELEDITIITICGSHGTNSANSARLVYDHSIGRTGSVPSSNRNGHYPTQPVDQLALIWSAQMWHDDGDINALRRMHARDKKKVLVIVDDMVRLRDVVHFATKNGWFGPGTRIVVSIANTSKKVLEVVRIDMEARGGDKSSTSNDYQYVDVACFIDDGKGMTDGGGDMIMMQMQSFLANAGLSTDILVKFYKYELENVVLMDNGNGKLEIAMQPADQVSDDGTPLEEDDDDDNMMPPRKESRVVDCFLTLFGYRLFSFCFTETRSIE